MNGGLRKRAGRDAFDMSDSEDEAETQQRKKRAAFARMQKALMSDENIGKIAENPKQQAFFKTLADFADDADYDFLEMPEPRSIYAEDSQSQSQSQPLEMLDAAEAVGEAKVGAEPYLIPDTQLPASQSSTAMPPPNPLKRKSPSSQKENRPPPPQRRTGSTLPRRPISLADVQLSVSELLEDSRVVVPDSQYSASDSEDELEIIERPRKRVVDRLTLSRQGTLDSGSGEGAGAEGMAWSARSTGVGFRVPSLIRRATTNLSSASTTSTSAERSGGTGQADREGVRRGGSSRSNIHAQAREAERRAMLERKERRREEGVRKKVRGLKGGRSVLGDLGGGFE